MVRKDKVREFISKEIRRQRKEGKPQPQAVAIAFSKARMKFGTDMVKEFPKRKRLMKIS